MARRKLTAWEQALKDAAKELGAPKDDFRVEKLATLTLLLKVQRSQWTQGKLPNSGDMIEVMNAIEALRTAAGLTGPRGFNIKFVHRYVGIADITCPHCKKTSRHEVSNEPFERDSARVPADAATDVPSEPETPSSEQPTADVVDLRPLSLTVASHREGVSASSFHNAVLSNGEVAPIKRTATRLISPMSHINGKG